MYGGTRVGNLVLSCQDGAHEGRLGPVYGGPFQGLRTCYGGIRTGSLVASCQDRSHEGRLGAIHGGPFLGFEYMHQFRTGGQWR